MSKAEELLEAVEVNEASDFFHLKSIDDGENIEFEVRHGAGSSHDDGKVFSIDLTAEHAKKELPKLKSLIDKAMRKLK